MITNSQMYAADEAFGHTKYVEPWIGMRMKTGKKFNKTHDKIYRAYKLQRDVVDDDALLLAILWKEEGWLNGFELYQNLSSVTHPETISRRRRELHEAGLIEYSDKALKTREQAFKNERDKASPIPPQVKGKIRGLPIYSNLVNEAFNQEHKPTGAEQHKEYTQNEIDVINTNNRHSHFNQEHLF